MKWNKLLLILFLFFLPACAAREYTPSPLESYRKGESGIYHKVQPGETLWRIADAYGVSLEKIAQANRLPDPAVIVSGQLLFIPGVSQLRKVPSADTGGRYVPGEKFIWPVKGEIISKFGVTKGDVKNKGIDIRSRAGTVVVAARSGKVVFCQENFKGLGKTLIIDHGDGYSTLYSYSQELLVRLGDNVKRGDRIAMVGTSGRAAEPCLHFQVRKGSIPQDPLLVLP